MNIAKVYEHKAREIVADFGLEEGSGFVQANEYEDGKFTIRMCIYRPYNSNDASQSMGEKPYEQHITVCELISIRDAISDFIIACEKEGVK